jgi:hypothetical protein
MELHRGPRWQQGEQSSARDHGEHGDNVTRRDYRRKDAPIIARGEREGGGKGWGGAASSQLAG